MFNSISPYRAALLIVAAFSPAASELALSQTTEEIVVTARKREESLQDVPLSVTAFTAEQLQASGAFNNEDVATLTVNFNTVSQVGRRLDRPTIRGQSAAAVGGEPNASYFIDGAFVSGSISTATLGPVERVEILRGPQSSQFGRATFAGAVNYVTRRPSNELTGELTAKIETDDSSLYSGWVSGPVVEDKLLYFVSGSIDQYGGEWKNDLKANQADPQNFIDPPQQGDNSDLGGTETKDLVTKLLWIPNDTSEVSLKLGYTEGDDDHYVQLLQEPGELNCYLPTAENRNEPWYDTSLGAFCGTINEDSVKYQADNPFNPYSPDFDPASYLPNTNPNGGTVPNLALINNLPKQGGSRQTRYNLPDLYDGMELPDFSASFPGTTAADWVATPEDPGTRRETKRALLQYDQDIGTWTSTTRIAYNEDDFDQGFDLDRTEQRFFGGTFTNYSEVDTDDYSFEVRLDSPADEILRGSIGVYYFNSEQESRQKRFVSQGNGRLGESTDLDITNKALFGAIEYDFAENWTFATEVRYANDNKEITAPFSCGDDPTTPEREGQQVKDETDEDSLTPRFTLRWQPLDNATLYALAAKGNKPANFNASYFRPATADPCESIVAIDEGVAQIDEETAWTYETGGKASWMDGRLSTNLALFYIDWENQSVFQTALVGGRLTQITGNAGKSRIRGLELETALAVTNNLTASFSYGLQDGEFKEYTSSDYAKTTGIGLDANGNVIGDSNNVRGNQLPDSPKHSIVSALDYARDITTELAWFARTDYIWESERYASSTNFMKTGRRRIWNARVGLDNPGWTVTTYVNNILDDTTPSSVFGFQYLQDLNWENGNAVQANSIAPVAGRQYGVEVNYRFGN